ncbi:hypothetical protein [Tenuifilum osseticum]|uniref:hypothetical protein n=1 Tax=Tenuifilum osseticum TaxID=3374723 RepID=UPI0034E3F1E6
MKRLLFIAMILIFFSCEKEEYLTIGEINAKEISECVKNNKLQNVTINSWEISWVGEGSVSYWKPIVTQSDFRIEKSFIVVSYKYYNLERLYYFNHEGNTLILYLK